MNGINLLYLKCKDVSYNIWWYLFFWYKIMRFRDDDGFFCYWLSHLIQLIRVLNYYIIKYYLIIKKIIYFITWSQWQDVISIVYSF